jgi:ubiquinone/menaquinone biosynthesis C-methylase UbiE
VAAFNEVGRVLRPGGRLVVAVGDPEEMTRMAVTAYGFRLRPVEDLVGAMTAAGLSGVRAEPLVVSRASAHVVVGTA